MKILILNSSSDHPINKFLDAFCNSMRRYHDIGVVRSIGPNDEADILFLVSCNELIASKVLKNFKKAIVIHASDLPKGRGWSPHIWDIVNGKKKITLSMIEATAAVDSGGIYRKKIINIPETALWDEINQKLFSEEINLMAYAIKNYKSLKARPQSKDIDPTYFRKRTKADSELNIEKSLREQFNLLRVCDPDRYPAFFKIDGKRFTVKIERSDDD